MEKLLSCYLKSWSNTLEVFKCYCCHLYDEVLISSWSSLVVHILLICYFCFISWYLLLSSCLLIKYLILLFYHVAHCCFDWFWQVLLCTVCSESLIEVNQLLLIACITVMFFTTDAPWGHGGMLISVQLIPFGIHYWLCVVVAVLQRIAVLIYLWYCYYCYSQAAEATDLLLHHFLLWLLCYYFWLCVWWDFWKITLQPISYSSTGGIHMCFIYVAQVIDWAV